MVCILLADGFEEAEALVPADLLRRAGIEIVLTGLDRLEVTGSHNITVKADKVLSDIDPDSIDLLFLPGGLAGVKAISNHPGAIDLIRCVTTQKRYIAAICAAPTLLASLGLLEGRKAVCFPGMEEQLGDALLQKNTAVVTDENFITGEAAGSAFTFGFKLIEILKGQEAVQQVKSAIHYHEQF